MSAHYVRHAVFEYMERLLLALRQQQSWGGNPPNLLVRGLTLSGVCNGLAYEAPILHVWGLIRCGVCNRHVDAD